MFVNTSNNTGDETSSKSSRDPVAVLSVCRKGTIFTIHKNKVIDTIE